ncbi:aldehyde dehydrogenase family protein [Neisseria montereyensis]|uniref:Aldehyde dehydrogenase family protein n=1 Tax=Neisseria montereyensis TaxID=2973938 RepID=A0ABT2F9Q4_9NEIS|nr:aldehyde dehydrogenase family protein [Neisseria montereyensis]MCS4532871.1 aldehyde dehydrogenase family protein [Neisseria montereyensis]
MASKNHTQHWINGEWVNSGSNRETTNPSTGEVIGTYVKGGKEEAELAIKAAQEAFANTDWRTNRELRHKVLLEMAEAFEARKKDLATMIATENGKLFAEASFETEFVKPGLHFAAATVYTDYGRAAEWGAGKYSMLVKEPVGVVGISTPWNSPLALLIRSLAPALAVGCTTVLKMPDQTALTNGLIAEVLASVKSLPKGVINMVTGGHEVLEPLISNPAVPVISFTGSTSTGRALQVEGAKYLKRLSLELGGKTPLIVFDDADLDALIPKAVKALTVFSGQFCMTGSRILVQKGIADEVRKRLSEALSQVKVGPAMDPQYDMGALIDMKNVQRVNGMVEDAIAKGAKALVRGGPYTEGELAKGAFYRPTLLEVNDSQADIVQLEVFGPVLTLEVFETEREAVEKANATEYGLAASIWTRDVDRPLRVGREIEAGTVWINDWVVMRDEFEEGGYKQSGVGRLRGMTSVSEFVEVKHIVLQPGTIDK